MDPHGIHRVACPAWKGRGGGSGGPGGRRYCGKPVRTVPDDMKPGGLALQQDQTEFVRARCGPASMSRVRARQEGAQCTPGEIRDMRSMTGSLHWVTGSTRPDEAFATSQLQRKQSAPLVSDHKRAVQTIKRLRDQPEILLDLCLPRCACLCTQTQPFTTPMPILTKKDQTVNGRRGQSRRVSVSAPSTVRWSV